jgi:para-nitrobenzyl esterase
MGIRKYGLAGAAAVFAAVLASVTPSMGAPAPTGGDVAVRVDGGAIVGKRLPTGVRAYLGIPYAAPPVRELRWREPQPVKPWSGVYNADRFSPECLQGLRNRNANQYFGEEATSEDCLYLNVWAPARASRAPVIVYIYGGAFNIGSAAMPIYGGQGLAQKGVVFVNLNYRLGPFGFMAHPALTSESSARASGNYALLDQIAALKWVQRNIAKFGGDPGNVTIVGQSAGGASVSLLHASPLAHGLFQRAVSMSGNSVSRGFMGGVTRLAQAEQDGVAFQNALKVADIAQMRALPGDRILTGRPRGVGLGWAPIVEGHVLPEAAPDLFAAKRQNDVPLMLGFTSDESFNGLAGATSIADYRARATRSFGARAEEFLKLYPAATDADAARVSREAARDASIALATRDYARAQINDGHSPAYVYFFSKAHRYPPGVVLSDIDPATAGAYHTSEVPFWLDVIDAFNVIRPTRAWTRGDHALADRMAETLISFARSGKPTVPGGVAWPAYEPQQERIVEFGDQVRVISWPNREKLDFFRSVPPARGGQGGEVRD